MSSGGSGVWLGEEEVGKGFRLHQCKGEVKSRKAVLEE